MAERPSNGGLRVAVLSCGDIGREVCARLLEVDAVSAVALVTAPYRVRRRGRVARLRRSLRYDGVLSTLGALVRRFAGGVVPGPAAPGRSSERRPTPDRTAPYGAVHGHFASFRSAECLAWLRDFGPDLGVVAGTHVLPAEVYDLPVRGSVNLHMGKAPEYRGAAPAFWELFRCESGVGVTIHRVTDELDGGAILAQEVFPLDEAPAGDPLRYLERFRREVLRPNGVRLLADTVEAIALGEAVERPQDPDGARTRGRPTRRDVWTLRGRVLRRRVGRRAKDLLGRLLFATRIHRRLLRNRAVVVLFHRVDDALADDPLSCTVPEFRAYCTFFARHFDVVPLGRLLDDLEDGSELSGKLAITFDDGYRDNLVHAAPELQRRGLPAVFFLATGYIGSEATPWWDRRLDTQPAWMSWDEVGRLRERGFELGAHGRTHADLGRVEGAEARREIEGARRDIRERVGVDTPYFSYPYGGREHITEANRLRVREAGYRCCVSAHGGAVHPETDPHRLPRVPVSGWYVSPYHLGADLVATARRAGDVRTSRERPTGRLA